MNYEKTTIGLHCTVTSSKRFHASERTKDGVPFYCSKEIIKKVNGEKITECDYISEDAYNRVKEVLMEFHIYIKNMTNFILRMVI